MISHFLESNLVWRIGWTLLHSLWQLALVGLVAAILLRALRLHTPQLRYSTACLAMLAMFVLPAVTFSTFDPDPNLGNRVAANGGPAIGASPARQISVPSPGTPDGQGVVATIPVAMPGNGSSEFPMTRASSRTAAFVPWIATGWLVGSMGLSLWNLGAWIAAQRLRSLTTSPAAEHVQTQLGEIARRMKVSRSVQLLDSLLVETPMMIGYLRPTILLPASLHTYLTATELDALLAHELAHIRRHDYLVNLLQTVAETILFYHPVVWWISGRIRVEREFCCDDAASVLSGRVAYARALATVAQGRPGPHLAMAARGQRSSVVVARVRRVLGAPASDGSTWLGGMLLVLAMAVPFAAGLSFAAESPHDPANDDQAPHAERPRASRRVTNSPVEFTAEQDVTLTEGRQKAFAGIDVELGRWQERPALRFIDLYAVRTDRSAWKEKTAQQLHEEYQQGVFAILPEERGAWIPLDHDLPIVIYLGGVGLVEVLSVSDGDALTATMRFKILQLPLERYGGEPVDRDAVLPPLRSEETADKPGVTGALLSEPSSRPESTLEDRERAARLDLEMKRAAGTRQVFHPTTRDSGRTSWSQAFPRVLAGGTQGHMMLVQAHLGDRWPVTLQGEREPLFHSELVDGYDAAVTVRIERAGEFNLLTLARDEPRIITMGGKRCRIAYVSTTVAPTDEPLLVDHATIVIEIHSDESTDAEGEELTSE